ncbi:MAG TPA: MASE4 domain-containing protein [Pseudolabrys sp.]
MDVIGGLDTRRRFLATAIATRAEQRIALAIAVAALLAFVAAVPFVRVPLAKMPAFIPSYEAALFLIDLVTAALLYEQFVRLRSVAVLALASGYLFDAFIIVPHALSFPGAFAPDGLLGAGPQTTAWLYVFWHGGFPLFVMAYAILRRRERKSVSASPLNAGAMVFASIAGNVAIVAALTLAATWGHDALPVVMQGGDYSLLVSKGISPAVWVLTLVAMLMLWQRPQRLVDLWLMLVMWIWLFDIALAAVIGSSRFDLGFYAGRVFGLIAASFLLLTLLIEMARLYAGVLGAADSAEQRLLELLRAQARSAATANGKGTDAFVLSQNIAHFRSMLESGALDDTQRDAIRQLLAEEEAKLNGRRVDRVDQER